MRGSSSSLSSLSRRQPWGLVNIDDLPDAVLIEVLCRLSCSKLIFQCKCVCKRWFTLISDPYFVDHYLRHQSDKKRHIIRTLIYARKYVVRLRFYPWTNPTVVATYNDLILCYGNSNRYCICNPCTMQWVALPRIPTFTVHRHSEVRVGFICDIPCYNYKEEEHEDQKGHVMQHKAAYRCKVVRIRPPEKGYYDFSFELIVDIFSSETGEWSEAVVSSPRAITSNGLSFPHQGILYWLGREENGCSIIFGLDPFSDKPKCLFIAVYEPLNDLRHFGVCGGCIRMCGLDMATRSLIVFYLKAEEDGKLCLSKRMVYSLEQNMYLDNESNVSLRPFDPNNEDVCYLYVNGESVKYKYNFRTRKWSKIVEKIPDKISYSFVHVQPWWPTPVPRLPQHACPAARPWRRKRGKQI
ncbi:hypothetical protein CerSpe_106800 [Prunus speciosa]